MNFFAVLITCIIASISTVRFDGQKGGGEDEKKTLVVLLSIVNSKGLSVEEIGVSKFLVKLYSIIDICVKNSQNK